MKFTKFDLNLEKYGNFGQDSKNFDRNFLRELLKKSIKTLLFSTFKIGIKF
jgi:hypothetical protein